MLKLGICSCRRLLLVRADDYRDREARARRGLGVDVHAAVVCVGAGGVVAAVLLGGCESHIGGVVRLSDTRQRYRLAHHKSGIVVRGAGVRAPAAGVHRDVGEYQLPRVGDGQYISCLLYTSRCV